MVEPPAERAWCFTPREPLLLRRGTPRLWGRMGLRQVERGASLPANPCSFVVWHHDFGGGWASGKLSVVLHSPRTLVPSSRGTTSLGADGLRQVERGASLPANPCSFVAGHHVFGGGWASGKLGVVLRSSRTLVPSSRGTTTLGLVGLRQVGRDPARPARPKK